VRFQKLVQPRQVDEDSHDKATEWQESQHGKPKWELDEKEHHDRHWYHESKECSQFWQDEYIQGQ